GPRAGARPRASRAAPGRSRAPRYRAARSAAPSAPRESWRQGPASLRRRETPRTPPRARRTPASGLVSAIPRAPRSRSEVPPRGLQQHFCADPQALLVHVEAGMVVVERETAGFVARADGDEHARQPLEERREVLAAHGAHVGAHVRL